MTSKELPNWDRIPSYEESQSLAQVHAPSLSAQLAEIRRQRIDSILSTHLLPQLHAQVQAGLHRSTTVIIPRDSSAAIDLEALPPAEAHLIPPSIGSVQDLPLSDTDITLVQLTGSNHTTGFWRQPGSATSLCVALRSRLRAQGHPVEDDEDHSAPAISMPPPLPDLPPPPRKRGFFRRTTSCDQSAPPDALLGPDKSRVPRDVQPGQVRVSVQSREVAVRCYSAMGLYDSRNGWAVVVRTEIGVDGSSVGAGGSGKQ